MVDINPYLKELDEYKYPQGSFSAFLHGLTNCNPLIPIAVTVVLLAMAGVLFLIGHRQQHDSTRKTLSLRIAAFLIATLSLIPLLLPGINLIESESYKQYGISDAYGHGPAPTVTFSGLVERSYGIQDVEFKSWNSPSPLLLGTGIEYRSWDSYPDLRAGQEYVFNIHYRRSDKKKSGRININGKGQMTLTNQKGHLLTPANVSTESNN